MNNTIIGINNEQQFIINITLLILNTLISFLMPLLTSLIMVLKQIRKSRCCGGELIMESSKSKNDLYDNKLNT